LLITEVITEVRTNLLCAGHAEALSHDIDKVTASLASRGVETCELKHVLNVWKVGVRVKWVELYVGYLGE